MRNLLLAVFGAIAVSSAVSAQQPQYQPAPQYPAAPAAVAGTPLPPAAGANVVPAGAGCASPKCGPVLRGGFSMSSVTGGNCALGAPCQNGCGSLKSDLGFHFGSCKQFFAPCGPTPFAAPWGQGYGCPRTYDSYANH